MSKFKKLSLLFSSFAAVATLPMVAASCSKTEETKKEDPKPADPVNPTPQPGDNTPTPTPEPEKQPATPTEDPKVAEIKALFEAGKWFVSEISEEEYNKFKDASKKRLDVRNNQWFVNNKAVAVNEFNLSAEALAFGDLVTNDMKYNKGKIGATVAQGPEYMVKEDGSAIDSKTWTSLSARLTYEVDETAKQIKIVAGLYKVVTNSGGNEGLKTIAEPREFIINVKASAVTPEPAPAPETDTTEVTTEGSTSTEENQPTASGEAITPDGSEGSNAAGSETVVEGEGNSSESTETSPVVPEGTPAA